MENTVWNQQGVLDELQRRGLSRIKIDTRQRRQDARNYRIRSVPASIILDWDRETNQAVELGRVVGRMNVKQTIQFLQRAPPNKQE